MLGLPFFALAAYKKIDDDINSSIEVQYSDIDSTKNSEKNTPTVTQTHVQNENTNKESLSTRDYFAKKYLGLINRADNFFSGKRLEQDTNNSFLKAEYEVTEFERSDTQSDFRIRAKVDLPGTKKRLRLFVDSDLEQDESIGSRGRGVAAGRDVSEERTSAGVEFLRSQKNKFKKSIQVGVRTGSSLRPFIRLRLRNTWQLPAQWDVSLRQDFWHLDDVGFGETTRVEFRRVFDDRFNLRVLSELEYRDEPDPLQYLHEWVLGQKLTDYSALIYRVGGLGKVKKEEFAQEQFIAMGYRRLIYKDWAYINFTPRVIFSDNTAWKHEGAFSIRLEIFFTDKAR